MTAILGLSAFYHDSAAALVIDGQIVAAAQEERFTRKKHDPAFPAMASEYCLKEAGISLDELDYGIVSVAVPVRDSGGKVVAAINCSTSTTRISQDELVRTRLPLLQEAAGAIEAELRRFPMLARSLAR
jgi:IclR family pca regulon transcriptional regulator